MPTAAVFDLDRTLLLGASGPILSAIMREQGLIGERHLPGERLAFGVFDLIGETLPSMLISRQGMRATKGWSHTALRAVGAAAAAELADRVQPFALATIEEHRAAGRLLLLATTTPYEAIKPFADLLGFDDAIGTRFGIRADGTYDGSIDGEFVWSRGKARSVRRWARLHQVDLDDSHAYSDSVFDLPLLSSVGHPVAVNPDARLLAFATLRRWPIVWFNAPPGVPKPGGVEPQQILSALARPGTMPWIDLEVRHGERTPSTGGVILASNHRSALDPLVLTQATAMVDRPVRFLSKKEVTDAPVVGSLARAMGAIRVDRASGAETSLIEAARSLRAGELVAVFPQGTIPRGEAFFDPVLRGRRGAARLALETGSPLLPVGIWGTERVWPRNRRVPYVLNLADPPRVTIEFGEPYHPSGADPTEATEELMARIADLLPPEARRRHAPSADELAATFPPGRPTMGGCR